MSAVSGSVLPRPELLVGSVHTKINEDGIITDEATLKIYSNLLNNFIAFINHSQSRQA
jgi:hypothetical protein